MLDSILSYAPYMPSWRWAKIISNKVICYSLPGRKACAYFQYTLVLLLSKEQYSLNHCRNWMKVFFGGTLFQKWIFELYLLLQSIISTQMMNFPLINVMSCSQWSLNCCTPRYWRQSTGMQMAGLKTKLISWATSKTFYLQMMCLWISWRPKPLQSSWRAAVYTSIFQ